MASKPRLPNSRCAFSCAWAMEMKDDPTRTRRTVGSLVPAAVLTSM